MARDAEDAALFLDAIVGFTRLSPISVAPPWRSALAELQRRDDIKGLRVAYVSDIAGIGVDVKIDSICRDAASRLSKLGAQVEQIEFDASNGGAAYQTWRGYWMVGQAYQRLSDLERLGSNLKGNIEAGLKLTPVDFGAAEQKRTARDDHRHADLLSLGLQFGDDRRFGQDLRQDLRPRRTWRPEKIERHAGAAQLP